MTKMPYKWANKSIKLGVYDRRRCGLTDEDKEDIKRLHKQNMPVREIAKRYEKLCSRRTIQFILYPERLKQLQKRNAKEQHWKKYYNREQLTKAKRKWERYKQNLVVNKKII
jgi:hypothetical protein